MAGISSKALGFGNPQNKKGYNGNEIQNKEFSDGNGLEQYDFNARTYDQQIGRFIQIDPMSDKFSGLTPFSYCANNPISLVDPNGDDWTLSAKRNDDGSWTININFKAQILNSSKNANLDLKGFANELQQEFESVFNASFKSDGKNPQINVIACADITVIKDKKDLAKDATLLEIRDDSDPVLKTDKPGYLTAGIALNGKEIVYNEKWISKVKSKDKRTGPHEIGHTGGLAHPKTDMFNTTNPRGPIKYEPSNFMNQTPDATGAYSNTNFTGVTREQVMRIYNLYLNNGLNKKDGVHPVKQRFLFSFPLQ